MGEIEAAHPNPHESSAFPPRRSLKLSAVEDDGMELDDDVSVGLPRVSLGQAAGPRE